MPSARTLSGSAILVVAASAAVLAFACSASKDEATVTAAPASPSAGTYTPKPPPTGPADPVPAPDPLTDKDAGDCTASPGTFYGFTLQTLTYREPVPTCRFAGKVLLVVNVASQCGFTPQYAPLEALYETYKDKGFYVLGFPSKSFDQEYSDEKDISAFCTTEYNVTFPMFSLGNVNPPDEQPLYTWLKSQAGYTDPIPWNFEKWILSRKGEVVKRVAYNVSPDDPSVVSAIEGELAK